MCREYDIPCLLEHNKAITAAESLSYIVKELNGDIYLNIQGDEPLIEPKAIEQVIAYMLNNKEVYYLGLRSHISTEKEFKDRNVVKAVIDANGYAMYFSRSPISSNFDSSTAFRVMGMYGYRAEFLKEFASLPLGTLQAKESGVEMLRAMEAGYKIKLIETEFTTIGVDLSEHVPLIEKALKDSKRA